MNKTYFFDKDGNLVSLGSGIFEINEINEKHGWVYEPDLGYFTDHYNLETGDWDFVKSQTFSGVLRSFYTVDDAIRRINESVMTIEEKELAIKKVKQLPEGTLFIIPQH